MKIIPPLTIGAAVMATAPVSADILENWVFDIATTTTSDFGGATVTANVADLYVLSDDPLDSILQVFDFQTSPGMRSTSYFQSATGAGWLPENAGGPFDTETLRQADSFVTIGGMDAANPEQTPGAGVSTLLDGNFGGNSADRPGENSGWFNASPANGNGVVGDTGRFGLGLLLARFSFTGSLSGFQDQLDELEFKVTWNQGIGTPVNQVRVYGIPAAPTMVGFLAMAGLQHRRRSF